MDELMQKLDSIVVDLFAAESSGHDLQHARRVLHLGLKIQEKEGGDREVIAAACLLHDVHRLIQIQTGRYCHPRDSLSQVRGILEPVGLDEAKIADVLHCIEFHEEYNFSSAGKTAGDIETLILQDADNLDAMGAIGIARTCMFAGAHDIPLWVPDLRFDRQDYDEAAEDPSTIHHFYSKLLKLKDNMNTQAATELAQGRHDFMQVFLDRFFAEWKGEI